MITNILSFFGSLGRLAKLSLKQWSNPATASLVTGALSDLTRSRADLIAENVMLRQQLIVLNRQLKRPQLTDFDRIRLVLAARCTQFWQQALFIVQPDTLLRWHRDLFRLSWPKMHRCSCMSNWKVSDAHPVLAENTHPFENPAVLAEKSHPLLRSCPGRKVSSVYREQRVSPSSAKGLFVLSLFFAL